jgi:hypothetical protein
MRFRAVVFITLQLTLDHVIECSRDHIRLLYDLPNDTTLAQEIVVSSVFSVTEILAIEDNKLNRTFLHVVFGSHSLLNPTSDQISSDTNNEYEGPEKATGPFSMLPSGHIAY